MSKVHSHYENLKVARDARPEEIRAAYRSLTGKYHPDRNAGNAEASRIMAVINVAYGVLSDPVRRREHDQWIVQAERETIRAASASASRALVNWRRDDAFEHRRRHEPPPRPRASKPHWLRSAFMHLMRFGVVYVLVGVAPFIFFFRQSDEPSLWAPNAHTVNFAAADATKDGMYLRPSEAPNGHSWPDRSGYVGGYERRNTNGQSEVTVDNGENDADMFAKLVSLDGAQAHPVRTLLVRAHTQFKLTGITPGTYDLRYRNLVDGSLSRSQFFTLEEVPTPEGLRPTSITLVLDKAGNGNAPKFGLAEAEF